MMLCEKKPLPPMYVLKDLLGVDLSTGSLWWKLGGKGRRVGSVAGSKKKKGGGEVWINGERYQMSRIIWALVNGEDPGDLLIDFRNGDAMDHRPSNLRRCTASEDQRNRRHGAQGLRRVPGVSYSKADDKWRAALQPTSGHVWIGNFDTEEDAIVAVEKARHSLYGEFAGSGIDANSLAKAVKIPCRTFPKYPGVSFHKASGKFMAYVQENKKRKYFGLFLSEQNAAQALLIMKEIALIGDQA